MPSGTIKHCKCTEPESRQTVSFFLFIFFRWAGSNVQYTTKSWGGAWEWGYKTAAFYTKQHVHWLIAFSNIEVSQSGSNRSQKHGFKCDAIFFTCTHGHKAAIITQLMIVLKAQIDNFIWWEVSQEMYISYYADTTTTLAWFSKYSRFNIRQCSQQQLFLICISAAGIEDQIMYGQQEWGNCCLLCLQVHTILHVTISWSVVSLYTRMVSSTLCACARFYW